MEIERQFPNSVTSSSCPLGDCGDADSCAECLGAPVAGSRCQWCRVSPTDTNVVLNGNADGSGGSDGAQTRPVVVLPKWRLAETSTVPTDADVIASCADAPECKLGDGVCKSVNSSGADLSDTVSQARLLCANRGTCANCFALNVNTSSTLNLRCTWCVGPLSANPVDEGVCRPVSMVGTSLNI
ncbi:MAG: hypothetical protein MHM6MM_004991 [Cercozoa sp. M6MM]